MKLMDMYFISVRLVSNYVISVMEYFIILNWIYNHAFIRCQCRVCDLYIPFNILDLNYIYINYN